MQIVGLQCSNPLHLTIGKEKQMVIITSATKEKKSESDASVSRRGLPTFEILHAPVERCALLGRCMWISSSSTLQIGNFTLIPDKSGVSWQSFDGGSLYVCMIFTL